MNTNQKNDLNVAIHQLESVMESLISLNNCLGVMVEDVARNCSDGLNALYDVAGLNKRYNIEKNEYGEIIRRKVY